MMRCDFGQGRGPEGSRRGLGWMAGASRGGARWLLKGYKSMSSWEGAGGRGLNPERASPRL